MENGNANKQPVPMTTTEDKNSLLTSKRFSRKYFRNLGAGAMLAWFGFNGLGQAFLSDESRQLIHLNPVAYAGMIQSYVDEDSCRTVPPDEIYKKIETILNAKSVLPSHNQEIASVDELAKRNGLEIVPSLSYIKALDDTETVNQITEVMSNYTQLAFGFETQITDEARERINEINIDFTSLSVDENGFISSPFNRLITQQSSIDQFKTGVSQLLGQMGLTPTQLIRLTGLKNLDIIEPKQVKTSMGNMELGGNTNIHDNTIRLTTTSFTGNAVGRIFLHELGHKLDAKVCGQWGMSRDSSYTTLNSFGYTYGDLQSPALRYNGVSEYSTASPVEDKAELFSVLLDGFNANKLNTLPEPLRRKAELLLARLENELPGITDYLSQVERMPA